MLVPPLALRCSFRNYGVVLHMSHYREHGTPSECPLNPFYTGTTIPILTLQIASPWLFRDPAATLHEDHLLLWQCATISEMLAEILHVAVPFDLVAGTTQELHVPDDILSSCRPGRYPVHL